MIMQKIKTSSAFKILSLLTIAVLGISVYTTSISQAAGNASLSPKIASTTPQHQQSLANGSNNDSTSNPIPTVQEQEASAELDDDQPVPVTSVLDNSRYSVEVRVLNNDGVEQAGIEVNLGEQNSKTDESGIAEFSGLIPGSYEVKVRGTSQSFTIIPGDPNIAQEFLITLDSEETNWILNIIIILGMLGLLVVVYPLAKFIRKKKVITSAEDDNSDHNSQLTEEEKRTEVYLKPNPPEADKIIRPNKSDSTDNN